MPGLEAETVAQLEEEVLKAIQQGVFEVGLGHDIAGTQAEEFEDVGIADDVGGLGRLRCRVSHRGELGFVFREAAALVVEAGDLAAQLADGPVAPEALDLVEAALGGVGEVAEFREMGEGKAGEPWWSHCLHH